MCALQMVPYKIVRANNGDAWVEVRVEGDGRAEGMARSAGQRRWRQRLPLEGPGWGSAIGSGGGGDLVEAVAGGSLWTPGPLWTSVDLCGPLCEEVNPCGHQAPFCGRCGDTLVAPPVPPCPGAEPCAVAIYAPRPARGSGRPGWVLPLAAPNKLRTTWVGGRGQEQQQ